MAKRFSLVIEDNMEDIIAIIDSRQKLTQERKNLVIKLALEVAKKNEFMDDE